MMLQLQILEKLVITNNNYNKIVSISNLWLTKYSYDNYSVYYINFILLVDNIYIFYNTEKRTK